MKEIVIISGKGGTGKTSITAAFAALSKQAVFADCDVDAADLHMLLEPQDLHSQPFISGNIASINQQNCTSCDTCRQLCRFDAISNDDGQYSVNATACEGCGVCVYFCPENTIDFPEQECGQWYNSTTRFGPMIHARLNTGAENSGKLVSLVRQEARNLAEAQQRNLILIDGPPGIGCPVIAAITGTQAVFIITEPTLSGQHDLLRVLELTSHFNIPAYVCVNKWDINPDMTDKIQRCAKQHGAELCGTIPYDPKITAAQIDGKTIIEYGDTVATLAIKQIWQQFYDELENS